MQFLRSYCRTVMIAVCFISAVFSGCHTNVGNEQPIDENRELLAETNIDKDFTSLTWSSDNTVVYFTGPAGLKSVNINTKSVSTVNSQTSGMTALTISADGLKFFYLAFPPTGGVVGLHTVAVSGGASQLIADTVSAYAMSPDGQTIAVTNAFTAEMSLIAMPAATRTPVGPGMPVTFSPDGLQLLYISGFNAIVRTIAGGAESTLYTLADSSEAFRTLRWGGLGVYGIIRDSVFTGPEYTMERVRFGSIANGTMSALYSVYHPLASPLRAYLSRDGQMFAYWSSNCIRAETIPNGGCVTSQYSISTFTQGFSDEKGYVLHKTGTLERGDAAFSPNKTLIAYVAEGKLYLVRL